MAATNEDPWKISSQDFGGTDRELVNFAQNRSAIARHKAEASTKPAEVWQMDVKICRGDTFTLAPITFTEGPLKGRQAFVIMSFTPFRFMDLPAELRTDILTIVLKEQTTIAISILKTTGRDHRPVRTSHSSIRLHSSFSWNKQCGKWLGMPPASLAVARVSKGMAQEALPLAYGTNKFGFDTTSDAHLFLETIGSSKQHLRYAAFAKDCGYTQNYGRKLFEGLLSADSLRSVEINHKMICSTTGRDQGRVPLTSFVDDALPLLKMLHESLLRKGNLAYTVLDIVKITASQGQCYQCQTGKGSCIFITHKSSTTCRVPCRGTDMEQHCLLMEEEMKATLAKKLKLKL